ncbi:hypothetical protein TRFO_28700 [Tritrichomonas foetus]|uniref:Uncharacterized protein n=1 Tax=Tritrichomonas foetus TaxID=1144522 RepID=A0A1J4JZ05_9EUKA|nr:hypothetical protein TRFO_28700 [Tritrichomonas foetus]|eukprot:OHT03922.1 hypothetical protein TRFO_28700 [Tritrichomonas foetus]
MGNCKDFMSPVPLEQMKRWLIRKAAGYEFNKSTSLLEVDQIKPKYTQIDSTKEINIKQFIRSEYKEKVEYERYQTKIKTFWEATFKNGSPSPQQLARLLATATTCKFPQHNLEKNIKILLELFSNSGLIQFPTFCLFCSYFSYTNLQNRISDISNHMQSHNFVYEEDCSLFHNNFSSFTSMAIPNIDNSFAPFFTPIICDTQFLALFEIQPLETWTVCLGRTPGDFVILRKTIDRIWKCVINFDPIKNCFKVPNSTKIFEQYNSLQEVIKVLGLDENCCFKHNNHPVVNEITFDLFLESMINDKEMSSPQIECEFPSFLDELI